MTFRSKNQMRIRASLLFCNPILRRKVATAFVPTRLGGVLAFPVPLSGFRVQSVFFVPSSFATISLVGRCIATNSFADLLANSFNFVRAASRPTTAARHMRAPSGRLSNKSYSRFMSAPFDSGQGCEKGNLRRVCLAKTSYTCKMNDLAQSSIRTFPLQFLP